MSKRDSRLAATLVAPAVLGMLAVCTEVTVAQSPCDVTEDAQCNAADGALGDNFGWSVGLSGDTTVIGAHGDDDIGSESGAAYIHRFDGANWNEEQKLTASDAAAGDKFGWGVAIEGDLAVVTAPEDGDGMIFGATYVFGFDGNSWIEEQKLVASDVAFGTTFGMDVDIDQGMILIGALDGFIGGSAYVCTFDGDSWIEADKITASDGAVGDEFGRRVSLSGNVALIGARSDDDLGQNSGAAYVFRHDGNSWIEEAKLVPTDGGDGDFFGFAVEIEGDVAVVTAPNHDGAGPLSDTGAVYVFRYNGIDWVEEAKLLPADNEAGDAFGASVAITGGFLYAGDAQTGSGAVYVFEYTGRSWVELGRLLPSDEEDSFGLHMAVDGGAGVVGASAKATSQGGAYVFGTLPPECSSCPWDMDQGGTVSTGDLLALLAAWGTNPGGPPDFNGDGTVGTADLLELLSNWGQCE